MKNRSHQCSHSPHLRETADKVRPGITIMANRDVGYNGDNLAHSRSSDKLCAYSTERCVTRISTQRTRPLWRALQRVDLKAYILNGGESSLIEYPIHNLLTP